MPFDPDTGINQHDINHGGQIRIHYLSPSHSLRESGQANVGSSDDRISDRRRPPMKGAILAKVTVEGRPTRSDLLRNPQTFPWVEKYGDLVSVRAFVSLRYSRFA